MLMLEEVPKANQTEVQGGVPEAFRIEDLHKRKNKQGKETNAKEGLGEVGSAPPPQLISAQQEANVNTKQPKQLQRKEN